MKVRDWREDEGSDVLTITLDGAPGSWEWLGASQDIRRARRLHKWDPPKPATFAMIVRSASLCPSSPMLAMRVAESVLRPLGIMPEDIGTLTVEQGPATDGEWTQITLEPGEPMVWPA